MIASAPIRIPVLPLNPCRVVAVPKPGGVKAERCQEFQSFILRILAGAATAQSSWSIEAI